MDKVYPPALANDMRATARGSERAWDRTGSLSGPDGLSVRRYRQKDVTRADIELVETSGIKRRLKSFESVPDQHSQGTPLAGIQAEAWMDGYNAGRMSVAVVPIRPRGKMKTGRPIEKKEKPKRYRWVVRNVAGVVLGRYPSDERGRQQAEACRGNGRSGASMKLEEATGSIIKTKTA